MNKPNNIYIDTTGKVYDISNNRTYQLYSLSAPDGKTDMYALYDEHHWETSVPEYIGYYFHESSIGNEHLLSVQTLLVDRYNAGKLMGGNEDWICECARLKRIIENIKKLHLQEEVPQEFYDTKFELKINDEVFNFCMNPFAYDYFINALQDTMKEYSDDEIF